MPFVLQMTAAATLVGIDHPDDDRIEGTALSRRDAIAGFQWKKSERRPRTCSARPGRNSTRGVPPPSTGTVQSRSASLRE